LGIVPKYSFKKPTLADPGDQSIPSTIYRRAKTGALFEAAATAGALSANVQDAEKFRLFGQRIGEAYQIADDLLDVLSDTMSAGKPVGRDTSLGRPNVARDLGMEASKRLFEELVRDAIASIPDCPGRSELASWTEQSVERIRTRAHVAISQASAAE